MCTPLDYDFFEPELMAVGYKGVFAPKPGESALSIYCTLQYFLGVLPEMIMDFYGVGYISLAKEGGWGLHGRVKSCNVDDITCRPIIAGALDIFSHH